MNIGFEGFEEEAGQLLGYVVEDIYDKTLVDEIAAQHSLAYTTNIIEAQNWNAQWESNFQPVIIDGFCTIRAAFHTLDVETPYQVLITPKMSFGTGHHATTQLMLMQMRDIDFTNKKVLDFGTGTGILAIMAEQLGASSVFAIDTDEWSYENAKENVIQNNCKHICVDQSTLSDDGEQYDIILANINRHILLGNMPLLYKKTVCGGKIIMSGLMHADESVVVDAAQNEGFKLFNVQKLGDWLLLAFDKKDSYNSFTLFVL